MADFGNLGTIIVNPIGDLLFLYSGFPVVPPGIAPDAI